MRFINRNKNLLIIYSTLYRYFSQFPIIMHKIRISIKILLIHKSKDKIQEKNFFQIRTKNFKRNLKRNWILFELFPIHIYPRYYNNPHKFNLVKSSILFYPTLYILQNSVVRRMTVVLLKWQHRTQLRGCRQLPPIRLSRQTAERRRLIKHGTYSTCWLLTLQRFSDLS